MFRMLVDTIDIVLVLVLVSVQKAILAICKNVETIYLLSRPGASTRFWMIAIALVLAMLTFALFVPSIISK